MDSSEIIEEKTDPIPPSPRYREVICKQGTDEWHAVRNTLLLTGSNVGAAVGHNPYKSKEELLHDLFYNKKIELNKAMAHGQKYEPIARQWYFDKFGFEVRESGILIPNFDPEIGGSIDGFTSDSNGPGLIEIKCPQKMYDLTKSDKNPVGMPMYHYDQVQFYLEVTELPWCDFVVYTEKLKAVKRVLRNKKYWDSFLYPNIRLFVDTLKKIKNNELSLPEIPPKTRKF